MPCRHFDPLPPASSRRPSGAGHLFGCGRSSGAALPVGCSRPGASFTFTIHQFDSACTAVGSGSQRTRTPALRRDPRRRPASHNPLGQVVEQFGVAVRITRAWQSPRGTQRGRPHRGLADFPPKGVETLETLETNHVTRCRDSCFLSPPDWWQLGATGGTGCWRTAADSQRLVTGKPSAPDAARKDHLHHPPTGRAATAAVRRYQSSPMSARIEDLMR